MTTKKTNKTKNTNKQLKTDDDDKNKTNVTKNNQKNNKENKKTSKNVIKISKKIITYASIAVIAIIILLTLINSNKQDSNDSPTNQYEFYNGYVFKELQGVENVWETTIKLGERDQRLEIRYHPLELEQYPYDNETNQYFYLTQRADGNVTISISDDIYYLSSNYITLASYDIARILRSFLGYNIQVSAEKDSEDGWIDCEDANINNLVVQMMIGEPRIEADNFCVKLYFEEPEDSLKISSLLIYNLLGIME